MSHHKILDDHILNIVQNNEILEQSDLQNMLKQKGYDIPQATLSRRLKRLKIAKVSGVYKIIDFNQSSLPLVLNMLVSEFGLIVLHVYPGQASSLAYFLDQKYVNYSSDKDSEDFGVLGTIAGDDTVLVIIKSKGVLQKVLNLLYVDFPYLKHGVT